MARGKRKNGIVTEGKNRKERKSSSTYREQIEFAFDSKLFVLTIDDYPSHIDCVSAVRNKIQNYFV